VFSYFKSTPLKTKGSKKAEHSNGNKIIIEGSFLPPPFQVPPEGVTTVSPRKKLGLLSDKTFASEALFSLSPLFHFNVSFFLSLSLSLSLYLYLSLSLLVSLMHTVTFWVSVSPAVKQIQLQNVQSCISLPKNPGG
jgi:hypothetical protein